LESLPARYRRPNTAIPEAADLADEMAGRKLTALRGGAEKSYLIAALGRHRGNIKEVCAEFQLSRSRLYQLMKKYAISPVDFRKV
jgi:transcriptional regulator of acetoin/glycerol metabolism